MSGQRCETTGLPEVNCGHCADFHDYLGREALPLIAETAIGPAGTEPWQLDDISFPIRAPEPEPMMVSRPCGCTSMVIDGRPLQVSWCVPHDPGYPPPGQAAPEAETYPAQIAVFCDHCGGEVEHDYVVHDQMTSEERLGVALARLTQNEGWSCTEEGDFCPACKEMQR